MIHYGIERNRHGKPVVKIDAQPKSLDDPQDIRPRWILSQGPDQA